MTSVLYPGSFDPLTLGHVDVITRASKIFDKIYVAISNNTSKKALFTPEERLQLTQAALKHLSNVEVVISGGLTVEIAHKLGVTVLVRGVRTTGDLESEMAISELNQMLDDNIQTVFIPASSKYQSFSSSMIKEIAKYGGDISRMVPKNIEAVLLEKYGMS